MNKARNRTLALALATLGIASPLFAAQRTWEGNVSGDMTLATNWVGGVAPVANTDAIAFGAAGTSGTALTLNSNIQYTATGLTAGTGAIQFNAGSPSYTISGTGTITMGTGAIVNNGGGAQTINNQVNRNTSNAITIGASYGSLVFNGAVNYNTASASTIAFAFGTTQGGRIIVNGNVINSNATPGTGSLTLNSSTGSGYGTLALNGNNTGLNGTLTLGAQATVRLGSGGAVATGATIAAPNATNTTLWLASNSAINSFALNYAAGTAAHMHTVTVDTAGGAAVTTQQISAITVGQQQGLNFVRGYGISSGTPKLTVTGTTLIATTATPTGRTHIFNAGGVDLSLGALSTGAASTANQWVTLDGTSSASEVTGAITNGGGVGGTLSVNKAGTGTWTLSGTNTYTGGTTVNNGTLRVDFNAAGAPASDILYNGVTPGQVSVNGGNLSFAGKDNAASVQNLGAVQIGGNLGGGSITLRPGSGSGTLTVNITGFTLNSAGTVNFDIAAGATLTNSGATANTFIGQAAYFGNEFARFDASKNVVAAVDANYTAISPTSTAGSSSYLRLDGAHTRGTTDLVFKGLRIGNTGNSQSLDLAGGFLTYSNSGLLYRGGSDNLYSIDNGTIRTSTANTTLDFRVASGATLTINAQMADNANPNTSAFSKSGAGTLVVAGSKSYTGRTAIYEGVYSIDTIATGGSGSGLGASTNAAANLYLYGGTLRYTGPTASTDRSFTVGPRGAVIDASGSGALTWTPAASIVFANTGNNNTTATAFNAAQNQSLTLTGANTDANTFAGVIADAAPGRTAVTKAGDGRWVLTVANTYTGGTTVNAGTLEVSSAGTFGTGDVNVTVNGATFGTLSIVSGANRIGDSATLSLQRSGSVYGKVVLGAGVAEVVGNLFLGGVLQPSGSYGATGSGAQYIDDNYFSGTGVLYVPEPATLGLLLPAAGLVLGRRRRRAAAVA
jgi:fibronectin-binding autotransporter adhesin